MRIVRPEPERKAWEIAGWTREPRNGYEWKRLKAGKPQPEERDKRWKKSFRCRRGHTTHKVTYIDGRAARICTVCKAAARKRYVDKTKGVRTRYSRSYKKRINRMELDRVDGYLTVPGTWLALNVGRAAELVKEGPIVIELHGEPAFEIRSIVP